MWASENCLLYLPNKSNAGVIQFLYRHLVLNKVYKSIPMKTLKVQLQSNIAKFVTLNNVLFPVVNAARFFQISLSRCCLMFLLEEAPLNNAEAFFVDVINIALLLINDHTPFQGLIQASESF